LDLSFVVVKSRYSGRSFCTDLCCRQILFFPGCHAPGNVDEILVSTLLENAGYDAGSIAAATDHSKLRVIFYVRLVALNDVSGEHMNCGGDVPLIPLVVASDIEDGQVSFRFVEAVRQVI